MTRLAVILACTLAGIGAARSQTLQEQLAARSWNSTPAVTLTNSAPPTNAFVSSGPPAPVFGEMQPRIEAVGIDLLSVSFQAKPRWIYFVESSPDLTNWTAATPHLPGVGRRMAWQFNHPGQSRFYRVQEGRWNGGAIVFTPSPVATNAP